MRRASCVRRPLNIKMNTFFLSTRSALTLHIHQTHTHMRQANGRAEALRTSHAKRIGSLGANDNPSARPPGNNRLSDFIVLCCSLLVLVS